LFYTATEPYSQHIAYSTDGLKTIRKTDKPVIPHVVGSNRDPKVVFCEEWDAYALILHMTAENYALFRSEDLLHWNKVQDIGIAGEKECPDLFPLTDGDGNRKWIVIGAHDRYLVGDMREDGFYPTQEAQSLQYGKSAYAGQTFSGLPNGRIVRIDWDRWHIQTPRFNGQMSFPAELTLKYENGSYYLCALPIKEIFCAKRGSDTVAASSPTGSMASSYASDSVILSLLFSGNRSRPASRVCHKHPFFQVLGGVKGDPSFRKSPPCALSHLALAPMY
jgi:sucrose-6-phosphate hydrolase SacC (GH32 family)